MVHSWGVSWGSPRRLVAACEATRSVLPLSNLKPNLKGTHPALAPLLHPATWRSSSSSPSSLLPAGPASPR